MLRTVVPAVAVAIGLVSWDAPAAPQDAAFPAGVSAAVDNCRACHSGDPVALRGYVGKFRSHEFIRLDESKTWDAKDPHSRAFEVLLSSDAAREMKKHMGEPFENDTRCLACHATDLKPAEKTKTPTDFHKADGVSCVACHGIQDEWQTAHWKEPRDGDEIAWRTFKPSRKLAAGMKDLRHPAERAQLCASCHVGSAKEGKVVTHLMYAAGHPPLPPFELATFQKGEPPHWSHPTDKQLAFFDDAKQGAAAKQDPNWRWNLFRFHAGESAAARDVASGAIASLLAEAQQLKADADRANEPEWDGVDFARFDCYACHHDLQVKSDRQKRGYTDRAPGRPPLKAWVSALPGVVAAHAAGLPLPELQRLAAEFPSKWAALNKAAVARPLGDPKSLSIAAASMEGWCDSFLKAQSDFAQPIYTSAEAKKLSELIAAAAGGDQWSADPEAAIHLTWAILRLQESPADKLKGLEKVVPLGVRAEPFGETHAGPLGFRATTPGYAARMKQVREFKGAAFRTAFAGAFPK